MNRILICLLFLVLTTGWSCGEKKDNGLSESDRRVLRAYASLALLYDAFPPTHSQDSLVIYQRKADSVLAAFGFSRDQFRREFENLVNSPERLQPMFQEISAELRKEMQKR